jgi:magnesium transporter
VNVTSELALCRTFINDHAGDAARLLERMADAQVAALLQAMPAPVAARALAAMVPTVGSQSLARLAPGSAAAAILELPDGYAAVLLRQLEPASSAAILAAMPADRTRLLTAILDYPPDSAGSMMDSRVFAARHSARVGDALTAWRRLPPQLYDEVFVVDDEHRLVGVARLRDLLSARRREPLTAVMSRAVSRLSATAPRAVVLNHPGWRHSHALPVVDPGHLLVGAISHATVRAILEEDALRRPSRAEAVTTVFALGELYWLGLSGVLDGVASAVRQLAPAPRGSREVSRGRT